MTRFSGFGLLDNKRQTGVTVGRIIILVLSQVPILLAYTIALQKLPSFRSHALVFATSFALSVTFLILVGGLLGMDLEWDLTALAEAIVMLGVTSSAMLLGSLATWRATRKVFDSTLTQISAAMAGGIAAFLLGGILGILLSVMVGGGFHI